MNTSRFLALAAIALLAVAIVPVSTADNRASCDIVSTSDAPQADHVWSTGAAKICAVYLNTNDAALFR